MRGADNLVTVKAINVLGAAHDSARELGPAEESYRLAIATYERILRVATARSASSAKGAPLAWKALGARHPYIAAPLGNLGLLYTRLGRYDEAIALMRRSNLIESDAYGPDHVDVACGLANIAGALRAEGKLDEAISEADASIAIYEKRFGADHVDLYVPLTEKGRALLERGDAEGAVAPLEKAVTLGKPEDLDPVVLAEARFALARALLAVKRDERRGLELAKKARAQFASSDTPEPDRVTTIDAWMAR